MENKSGQWKQILEVEPVAVHTLWKGWKRIKDIGKLIVYEKNDGTHWASINHGLKYELIKDQIYYKLVYQNFTSYLKQSIKGGFVALSFENDSASLNAWENLIKKFSTIQNFGKALESAQTRKKIQYHCPEVQKSTIHHETFLTPILKWGGKVQDTMIGKTQQVFSGGSSQEGYAQKTKRWIRNSWKAFTTKVHDTKQSISDKIHRKNNGQKLIQEESTQKNVASTKSSKKKKNETVPADTS